MKRFWNPLLCVAIIGASADPPQAAHYSVDSARSKIEIHVYREGLFKVFGHDHVIAAKQISGTVSLDEAAIDRSTVNLKVQAESLTVVDPGADEKERREVQEAMESDRVLDVRQHPEISFISTAISQPKSTSGGYDLVLTGDFRLHGVTRKVSVPVRVQIAGKEIRARGQTELLQTDYGMKPIRVGGGTVRVKDKVKVTFEIVGSK